LYEGTTAIQAQDFFFRKIIRDGGEAFNYVTGRIRDFGEGAAGGRLKGEQANLLGALEDILAMAEALKANLPSAQQDPNHLYNAGLGSVRFLMAVGDLIIGWRLLVQAQVALTALDADPDCSDAEFYAGKIAVATFFAANVPPLLSGVRSVLCTLEYDVMEIDEPAF
jgi:Acetyl-CoA dehydrogenase C-terminal like